MQHKKVIIILKAKKYGSILWMQFLSFLWKKKNIYETTVNETEFFFIYKEKIKTNPFVFIVINSIL